MSDLPPLLRRLEELEARRARENPRDAFLGVGICIIGLAVIFGGLRPVPGMAPWMIQVIGGFIVMLGLFWAFNALRMKRASTAASLIAGVLLLAIMNWGAFGPGERFCTTGRMRTDGFKPDLYGRWQEAARSKRHRRRPTTRRRRG